MTKENVAALVASLAAVSAMAGGIDTSAHDSVKAGDFGITYKVEWAPERVMTMVGVPGMPSSASVEKKGIESVCTFAPKGGGNSKWTMSASAGVQALVVADKVSAAGAAVYVDLVDQSDDLSDGTTLAAGGCIVPIGMETNARLRAVRDIKWDERTEFVLPNKRSVYITASMMNRD